MIHQVIELKKEGTSANGMLYTYFLDNSKELNDGLLRPTVLICPGGGYRMTSDREAELIALKFMAMGCHALVLRYSVYPAKYPTALLELALAMKYVREHAKEFYVDDEKIITCGFSAGGHLAASLGVFWNEGILTRILGAESKWFKPNGQILCYPVITSGEKAHRESFESLLGNRYEELLEKMSLEKQVNEDTPRTFIWHAFDDKVVPVENSILFVMALKKYGISTEFHMYERGGHGLGTAGKLTYNKYENDGIQKECETWMELASMWIENA